MINLVFRSVCTISDFVEGKMHLGNERKKGFFLCISLGFHYLCRHKLKKKRFSLPTQRVEAFKKWFTVYQKKWKWQAVTS